MSKLLTAMLLIGVFIIGGVTGGVAVNAALHDQQQPVAQDTEQTNTTPSTVMSGYGLTPTDMVDELSQMEAGNQFDWRYVNYLQTLR